MIKINLNLKDHLTCGFGSTIPADFDQVNQYKI